MAGVSTMGRGGVATGMTRALVACLAATAACLGVVGVAQAAPPHGSKAVIAAPAAAQQAAASNPKECWNSASSSCASSDRDVKLRLVSNGDTTGCTFKLVIKWGDKKSDTETLTGGASGTTYTLPHEYPSKPGAYAVSWTSTLESNSGLNGCQSSSGGDEFTLITAGIYAGYGKAGVSTAIKDGWSLIATVAGLGRPSHCQSPWTKPTTLAADTDQAVERALSARKDQFYPAWISYWTPAVPDAGVNFTQAGVAAGLEAGKDVETAAGSVATPAAPAYVVLDFEASGYNEDKHKETGPVTCGKPTAPGAEKAKMSVIAYEFGRTVADAIERYGLFGAIAIVIALAVAFTIFKILRRRDKSDISN